MKSRRAQGKSLVELLVVMGVMSVVLALCATSMATLFRLRHQMSRDREQAAALTRLATRLRQDAHGAISVADMAADGPSDRVSLSLADGEVISYRYEQPNIVREVLQGGKIVHRDRFTLPKSATAFFARDDSFSGKLLRLSVQPNEVKTRRTEMPRVAVIEAVVGLQNADAKPGREQ